MSHVIFLAIAYGGLGILSYLLYFVYQKKTTTVLCSKCEKSLGEDGKTDYSKEIVVNNVNNDDKDRSVSSTKTALSRSKSIKGFRPSRRSTVVTVSKSPSSSKSPRRKRISKTSSPKTALPDSARQFVDVPVTKENATGGEVKTAPTQSVEKMNYGSTGYMGPSKASSSNIDDHSPSPTHSPAVAVHTSGSISVKDLLDEKSLRYESHSMKEEKHDDSVSEKNLMNERINRGMSRSSRQSPKAAEREKQRRGSTSRSSSSKRKGVTPVNASNTLPVTTKTNVLFSAETISTSETSSTRRAVKSDREKENKSKYDSGKKTGSTSKDPFSKPRKARSKKKIEKSEDSISPIVTATSPTIKPIPFTINSNDKSVGKSKTKISRETEEKIRKRAEMMLGKKRNSSKTRSTSYSHMVVSKKGGSGTPRTSKTQKTRSSQPNSPTVQPTITIAKDAVSPALKTAESISPAPLSPMLMKNGSPASTAEPNVITAKSPSTQSPVVKAPKQLPVNEKIAASPTVQPSNDTTTAKEIPSPSVETASKRGISPSMSGVREAPKQQPVGVREVSKQVPVDEKIAASPTVQPSSDTTTAREIPNSSVGSLNLLVIPPNVPSSDSAISPEVKTAKTVQSPTVQFKSPGFIQITNENVYAEEPSVSGSGTNRSSEMKNIPPMLLNDVNGKKTSSVSMESSNQNTGVNIQMNKTVEATVSNSSNDEQGRSN